ncbi:hypothetical protein E8E12_007908 [Didymella heteroderae]|uniref:Uncharacterized protein n=1 Tax=Didymella heteroderae TaxID=1769908 RepID=A0A9P4WRU9_9PLEO|nr:hypothetical protein E8E12_007908 [Didymella heteroderae]
MPSTRPRSIMRAPSHIDFRTAVKMSQQAAIMSGVPKLTPLPTYQSQIVDECYSSTPTREPELRYTPDIEQDGFPFSRDATPQTPAGPIGNDDSLPMVDDLGYLDCQPWAEDGLVPVGLGFGNMDMAMHDDSWMTPEPCGMPNTNYFAPNADLISTDQAQNRFDTSLAMPADWTTFQMPLQDETVADEKALDGGLDSGIVMQGEWTQPPPQRHDMFIDMGNMITSAPYVPKMQAIPSNAPVWEDVFMPTSIPY